GTRSDRVPPRSREEAGYGRRCLCDGNLQLIDPKSRKPDKIRKDEAKRSQNASIPVSGPPQPAVRHGGRNSSPPIIPGESMILSVNPRPKPAVRNLALFSWVAVIGLLGGCQVTENRPAATGSGEKNTLAVSAAITNTDFTDGTGKIRIRVKTCDPTPAAFTNCAYCTADVGWLRIGGGANILGEANPGAMLQASFPSPDYFTSVNSYGCTGTGSSTGLMARTWVTRASGAQHQLQAYVVQMQLVDAQGQTFLPNTTQGIDNVAS